MSERATVVVPFVGTVSADKWAPCPGLDRLLAAHRCAYPGCPEDRADLGEPLDSPPRSFCVVHEAEYHKHVMADQHGWGIPI